MKAVLVPRSGSPEVMQVVDVPRPEPGRGQIIVRVRYSSVTSGDVNLRRMSRLVLSAVGMLFGFKPMTIAGVEFAGDVVGLGEGVDRFRVGDAVVGTCTGMRHGANAEYVVVPERGRLNVVAPKPADLSYRDAVAAIVGPMTAQQILRPDRIEPGDRVLIYGASGSVGSFAVQFAVIAGAEVTAVCSSRNLDMVKSLGAHHVVDYTAQDIRTLPSGYAVVMDAVGKLGRKDARRMLSPGGRFTSVRRPTSEVLSELERALALASAGKLQVPIDREVTLDEVPEAHRYAETGRKRGNIVVAILANADPAT